MNNSDYLQSALRTEKLPEMDSAMTCLAIRPQMFRLLHAGLGMSTESGEFLDQIKQVVIYGKEPDFANFFEEVGDMLWYIAIALDAMRTDFDSAMQTNIDKLRKRFPEKFEKMQALTRDLAAERKTLEEGFASKAFINTGVEHFLFTDVTFSEGGVWIPLSPAEQLLVDSSWEPDRDHNNPTRFHLGHLVVHSARTSSGHIYDAHNGWRKR